MSVEEIAVASPENAGTNNYPVIALAGIAAMLIGAGLWAAVSVITNMELGLMAILVGFLVGQAIQKVRKQRDRNLGILGAVLALIGCVLGNALSLCFFVAQKYGVPFDQTLARLGLDGLTRLVVAGFEPMDLIFYAIAVYEGFKFSAR